MSPCALYGSICIDYFFAMQLLPFFFDFITHLGLYMVYLTEINHFLMNVTYCSAVYAEILVLGTGARLERINPSVLALLKKKGIAVEVQDTVKYAQCVSVVK